MPIAPPLRHASATPYTLPAADIFADTRHVLFFAERGDARVADEYYTKNARRCR